MVDVAEEGDDRGPGLHVLGLDLGDVVLLVEALYRGLALGGALDALKRDLVAVALGDLAGHVEIDALVD